MVLEIFTNNLRQTQKTAQILAQELGKEKRQKQAFILGLVGELGAGKTSFIQGFARGLKIKNKVLSPTFLLLKTFSIPGQKNFKWLYHIDCYRFKKSKELLDLGFKEILGNPDNIIIIEWADKIKKIMPRRAVWINFKVLGEDKRKLEFKNLAW